MITPRSTTLGIALLATLALCAFSAQGASAAFVTATNTTAFECAKGGGSLDFADAHCDTTVSPGTGEYGHVSIPNGTKTDATTSNNKTANNTTEAAPAVLKGELLGASVTITCKKVSNDAEATSYVENTHSAEKGSDVNGTGAINFTECTLKGNGSSLGCKVKEPITLRSLIHGVEGTGADAGKMGIEFEPDPAGGPYVTLEFEGGSCFVKKTEVTGTVRGTASGAMSTGATLSFTAADESLTAFGNPATAEGIGTAITDGGGALTATTTT